MNFLFIGDIVGQPGRRAVRELVPLLRERHKLDFVIANGENCAGGSGITEKTAMELFEAGVDVITSGDHIWDQKDVLDYLGKEARLLRPANYPVGAPGRGSIVIEKEGGAGIAVLNIQGRTFMPAIENPFSVALAEVEILRASTKVIIVDMHAEATSEKIAMGRMLDGRVTAVLGTHTHVQTADEQIFPGGTGFLCDAGFTGPHSGVIGRSFEPIIERFLTNLPQRFDVAKGNVLLQGVLLEIDESTGKTVKIVRVSEPLPSGSANE